MAELEFIIKMEGQEHVFKATDKAGKGLDGLGKKAKKTNTVMGGLIKTVKSAAKGFKSMSSAAGKAAIAINQGLELVKKAYRGLMATVTKSRL